MVVQLIRKLGNIIALVGTVFWWYETKSWEPIVAACTFFIAYIAQEIYDCKPSLRPADVDLFREFATTLPSDGSIRYIQEHYMNSVTDRSRLDDLKRFLSEWGDPEHQFLNRALQKKLAALYRAVSEYISYYSLNTFLDPLDTEYARVDPRLSKSDPEQYRQIVAKLHGMADNIVRMHAILIKEGRKRINSMPIKIEDRAS